MQMKTAMQQATNIRLGDICTFMNGGTPSKSVPRYFAGNIPWITGADILDSVVKSARSFITEEGIANSATNRVPAGTVLLVTRTSVGKVAIAGIELCYSQDITALKPDLSKVTVDYLVQFLRTQEAYFKRRSRGATIKGVTKAVLENLEIPLPPIAQQKRIAAILDKAEELRGLRRKALGELDAIVQSIFLEMFGDPVTNPKGWERKVCKSLCSRITVGIVVQPASHYKEKGVPALRSLNIKQNWISMDNLVFFSQSDNETKLSKTRVKAGDVVLIRTGQPGTAAVIPDELDGVNTIDLLITTPRQDVVDSVYLCHFFNSSSGKQLVLSSQVGQIQKHLNVGILNESLVLLPPLSLQQEFARRVEAIEHLKATHRESLAQLDALFTSLQHRAFRGEL